jgi:HSP20 family protein
MASISLYRENPSGLFGLQRLNRLLDEAFAGWPSNEQSNAITSAWFAPTDVSEDSESLQVRMELPGVKPEEVKISLEDNILTIRGEKRQQAEERNERVHRYERSYGSFERSFALPSTVDPDKVSASYENGILTVSVPKAERARPREIPVAATAKQVSGGRNPEKEGSAGKLRG